MERVLLHHIGGSRQGQCEIYPIARFQALYFGRGSECDVRFSSDSELMVSRSHAVIEWDNGKPRRFSLTDLVSSNGTFVNGKRVEGMVGLAEGDQIQLGSGGPTVRFALDRGADERVNREITQSIRKITLPAEGGDEPETVQRPLPKL